MTDRTGEPRQQGPPVALYDSIAAWYDGHHGAGIGDPAAQALLAAIPAVEGVRVLDLACGQGRIARELARRGAVVTGIDISSGLIDIAQAQERDDPLGVHYVVGDAGDSTRLDRRGPFGGVVANMCVMGFDDLESAVSTVARVLAPAGWFVISMLHPCYSGSGRYSPSWSPAGYYTEGWWSPPEEEGVRNRVGTYHRTLATVVNCLLRNGFSLTAMVEPVWGSNERGPDNGSLPGFLILGAAREE